MRVYADEKRPDHSDIGEMLNTIETELEGKGNRIGYRQIHQQLRNDYGLIVQKEAVLLIIKELDPNGVQPRSFWRLRRREYRAKGCNYIWHIAWIRQAQTVWVLYIHGAIDGYSRRIL